MTTAHDILQAAAGHMKDRAATYDKPEGERSMGATVEAFKAVTGDGLMNTEERGWLFMVLLKAVRSQQGGLRMDSYEDGAAYFALTGEAAARDRKKPTATPDTYIGLMNSLYKKVVLNGHEIDTDFDSEKERIPAIGTNGNEGTHYAPTLPAGYSWADAPPDANVLVMATMSGRYHWADAFSDGARIYGSRFEQMGLTHRSGWKLIARRPGSDPGWVVSAGQLPDLPRDMLVEVAYRCGARRRDYVVNSVDWADVAAYRVVEALEQ